MNTNNINDTVTGMSGSQIGAIASLPQHYTEPLSRALEASPTLQFSVRNGVDETEPKCFEIVVPFAGIEPNHMQQISIDWCDEGDRLWTIDMDVATGYTGVDNDAATVRIFAQTALLAADICDSLNAAVSK
jgi:hypothetical protein